VRIFLPPPCHCPAVAAVVLGTAHEGEGWVWACAPRGPAGELVVRLCPGVLGRLPARGAAGRHRAREDILASIEELRGYKEHVFIPAAQPP